MFNIKIYWRLDSNADLWYWKWQLCQLSHNHYPKAYKIFDPYENQYLQFTKSCYTVNSTATKIMIDLPTTEESVKVNSSNRKSVSSIQLKNLIFCRQARLKNTTQDYNLQCYAAASAFWNSREHFLLFHLIDGVLLIAQNCQKCYFRELHDMLQVLLKWTWHAQPSVSANKHKKKRGQCCKTFLKEIKNRQFWKQQTV